jgi:hypothetical protein
MNHVHTTIDAGALLQVSACTVESVGPSRKLPGPQSGGGSRHQHYLDGHVPCAKLNWEVSDWEHGRNHNGRFHPVSVIGMPKKKCGTRMGCPAPEYSIRGLCVYSLGRFPHAPSAIGLRGTVFVGGIEELGSGSLSESSRSREAFGYRLQCALIGINCVGEDRGEGVKEMEQAECIPVRGGFEL